MQHSVVKILPLDWSGVRLSMLTTAQQCKKLMFADLNNYKLFKTDLNTTEHRFANISEVVDHQKEVVQNKIFETESKVIGYDLIQPPEIPITIQK